MNKYLVVYGKPRYFGIVAAEVELNKGDVIVSQTVRGEELSNVICKMTTEQEESARSQFRSLEHSEGMAKSQEPFVTDVQYVSLATQLDLDEAAFHRAEEPKWLKIAKEILAEQEDLEMKLVDIECLRCEKKVYFYFAADGRVDFRNFVKDLAREFKMRVELRQLSTRDAAKVVGGVAPCGHICCCNHWLNQFMPVSIKMIKEQNTALNPTKISGLCGRLMCCMCFEHQVYHEAWEGFPSQGSKIKMPDGRSVVVTGIDIITKKVRFYVPDRGEVLVSREELESVTKAIESGAEWQTEAEKEKMEALKKNFTSFAEIEPIKISSDLGRIETKSNNLDKEKQSKKHKKHKNKKKSDGNSATNSNSEQKQKRRIIFRRDK